MTDIIIRCIKNISLIKVSFKMKNVLKNQHNTKFIWKLLHFGDSLAIEEEIKNYK